MSKKDLVKSLFKDFSDRSTTHGISAIGYSEAILARIAWVFIFLFLFGYMVFTTMTAIQSYLSYDTVTKVSVRHVDNITFPSITICRNNEVSRSFLTNDFIGQLKERINELSKLNKTSHSELNAIRQNISLSISLQMENHNMTIPSDPPMILKSIPGACTFGYQKPCNFTSDFKRTYRKDKYAKCFTFNSKNAKKYVQYGSGPLFGLSMILYANQTDYVPLAGNIDGVGFTVYTHSSDTLPFIGVGGVLVAPGHVTRITVSKSNHVLKKAPYKSNCSDGVGILNYFPGRYSVLTCKVSCVLHSVYRKCGYADPLLKESLNNLVERETTAEMLKCRDAVVLAMFNERDDACQCPSPCYAEIFTPTVSFSKWPSRVDMEALRYTLSPVLGKEPRNISDDFILDNFAKVDIYFDTLVVNEYLEKDTGDFYDLLSDIGGHLGLWMGASFFSVIEFLALMGSVFIVLVGKSTRKASGLISVINIPSKTETVKTGNTTHNDLFSSSRH
eukprot:gene10268-11323_t